MFYKISAMANWSEFAAASPWLAREVKTLIHQYGPGFGYLATVRPDGGPRVHPVSPVVTDGGLFCFLIGSPKRRDLDRDGRYALQTFPAEHSDDEGYLTGRAHLVTDARRRDRIARACRAAPRLDWRLYELDLDVVMLTRRPAAATLPTHQIWHAPPAAQPVPPVISLHARVA
jgi:hypothetical protein